MRPLLLLLLAAAPAAAQNDDAALRSLLSAQARSNAAATAEPARAAQLGSVSYDAAGLAAPAPAVRATPARGRPAPLPVSTKPEAPAPSAAPRTKFSDGYLGVYPESDFELTTGRCQGCDIPREGSWYFLDEVVAVPKAGTPALVWIGSNVMLEHARLSADGGSVILPDGSSMPLSLTAKGPYNKSYYDQSSLAFFQNRPLRLRGEIVEAGGQKRFVARTIWPEDFRVDFGALPPATAKDDADIDRLVGRDEGGAKGPFSARLLWARGDARDWAGKPVMGVMLNGAQGDDDESLAGHFSLFTGRFGPDGEMADWMFSNFYDMDQVSEKGVIPALVPMDKYMADLNSGQSWYRPTDMLVMVMDRDAAVQQVQQQFREQYVKYYSHELRYNRVTKPCASIVIDVLRADGWNIPKYGDAGKGWADFLWAIGRLTSAEQAQSAHDSALQEQTRLIPRAAFTAVGGDLMRLSGAQGARPGRELTPFEKALQQDLSAVLYVRIPQLPSSREYGRDAIESVGDYFYRAPKLPWRWKKAIPTPPRPFPPPHP